MLLSDYRYVIVGLSICRTIDMLLSDYRHDGPSICYCRTIDMSDQRHVGPLRFVGLPKCRTIDMSDHRHVDVTNHFCRTSEMSDHRYVGLVTWPQQICSSQCHNCTPHRTTEMLIVLRCYFFQVYLNGMSQKLRHPLSL